MTINPKSDIGWSRAWQGRVMHYFTGDRRTLCGKELVAHTSRGIGFIYSMHGYPRCKRCDELYRHEKDQ